MNRFQRPSAGWKGSAENALDDIRHTYERSVWGRKTTGDVNMFPQDQGQEPEPPEPDEPEIGGNEIEQDDGMDVD